MKARPQQIVLAHFRDRAQAMTAMRALTDEGHSPHDVSLVANLPASRRPPEPIPSGTEKSVGLGAVVGGGAGLLAALLLPGLGALAGAVTGLGLGMMVGGVVRFASVPALSDELAGHYLYDENQGGSMLIVRSDSSGAEPVRRLLERYHPDHIREELDSSHVLL